MPLDTSTYALALLRLDGRRWNELRRVHAQISTQAAADGSSYLEMGNTKVICTVAGPSEGRGPSRGGAGAGNEAKVEVEIGFAGFSGVERKRRGRADKYVLKRICSVQYQHYRMAFRLNRKEDCANSIDYAEERPKWRTP